MDNNIKVQQIDPYVLINAEDEAAILDTESEAVIGGANFLYTDVYLGKVRLNNEAAILATLDTMNRIGDMTPFLGNYSVSEVVDIIDAGEAENYWSVGDVTDPIELNGTVGICEFDHESYRAMIIGFDHNMGKETGYCHNMALQFGQNEDGVNIAFIDSSYDTTGSTDAFRMNTSNTNSGGWESSYMRNTICPEFLEVLPSNLQNVVGTTTKYTDNYGYYHLNEESHVTATEDKIFLPAYLEVFSSYSYVNTGEADYQERYAWYTENDSSTRRIRYRHSAPSSASYWWLRSPVRTNALFCYVTASGGSSSAYNANISFGFAPAFNLIGSTPTLVLKPLSECSPVEIQDIVNSGEAANYWSIGDITQDITLNGTVGICEFNNESYHAILIGLDHNIDLETGGKHNAVFQFGQNDDGVNIAFVDENYDSMGSSTSFRMNLSETNSGGWESSYMRNTICSQFLEVLPTDWQEIIGITTKYTDNVGGGSGQIESNVTATEDKIFLLGCNEVGFSSAGNSYESDYTKIYDDMYNVSRDRVRYKHSSFDSASIWFLRSPASVYANRFVSIGSSGGSAFAYANGSAGFAPCFTIIGDNGG